MRQSGADRSGRGGFAHPAFTGCDDDHLAHANDPLEMSVQGPDLEIFAGQPDLEAPTLERGVHGFGGYVDAADAQELGVRLAAEDARLGEPEMPAITRPCNAP